MEMYVILGEAEGKEGQKSARIYACALPLDGVLPIYVMLLCSNVYCSDVLPTWAGQVK